MLRNWTFVSALALPALIASFALPVRAEQDPPLPDVAAHREPPPEEIIVTGHTVGSDSYFETDRLWANAPVDTGEALKTAPGISMIRKGGYANDIALRGLNRDRLNVIIDGQKVHGAGPNRMDPPVLQVDPTELASVEVIKGPFDVRHPGSLGGAIELRTSRPKQGTHGTVQGGYGSWNTWDVAATVSHGGEVASGLVGVAVRQGDPYETGDGKLITQIYDPTDPNRYREDTQDDRAFEATNLWGKAIFNPADGHELSFSVSRQDAGDVIYPALLMDATKDLSLRVTGAYDVSFDDSVLETLHFALKYGGVEHDMDNEKRVRSMMMPMLTNAESDTAAADLHLGFDVGDGTLTAGVGYFRRDWNVLNTMTNLMMAMPMTTVQDMLPDTTQEIIGGFLDYEGHLTSALELRAGLRLDYVESEAGKDPTLLDYDDYWAGSSSSTSSTDVSGNVQLDWSLAEHWNLFAGIGRSVRAPDTLELFVARGTMNGNWIGNPTLDTEKNHEIDLGASYYGERFNFTTTVFASWVQDYIALISKDSSAAGGIPANDAQSYVNTDAQLYGAELQVGAKLSDIFSLYGDLEYVHGTKDRNAYITDTDMPEIPPLHGHLGLRTRIDTFFVEIEGEAATEQDNVDSDLNENTTDSWAIANLRAGAALGPVTLEGGVRNLFDDNYQTHLSYLRNPFASGVRLYEPGRNVYLRLTGTF